MLPLLEGEGVEKIAMTSAAADHAIAIGIMVTSVMLVTEQLN